MKYSNKYVRMLLLVCLFSIFTSTANAETKCPAITSFMKAGIENPVREVVALQEFLRNSEKLDVDVTGNFDSKTTAAVEAFQRKYMSDIMTPWDATRTSGIVYITTVKKVNQLACGMPLSLNADELNTINAYKGKIVPDGEVAEAVNSAPETFVVDGTKLEFSSTTINVDEVVYGSDESEVQTASVGSTVGGGMLVQRFFHYLAGLFR